MNDSARARAIDAAKAAATTLGLRADDAIVLHNSNRIALHLSPCDVMVRVGPSSFYDGLRFEIEMGDRLSRAGAPVAPPDPRTEPRVYVEGDFGVTFWTYYASMPLADIAAHEYTDTLARLHAAMRAVDAPTPHFMDRVNGALHLLADHDATPDLGDDDRALLTLSLRDLSGPLEDAAAQLLHGEPHLGNLLRTEDGLRFIDLETNCRGPVEFDLAHGLLPNDEKEPLTAAELARHYPSADPTLIEQSHALMWAMVTTWRWQHDDELPNGRYWRTEGLNQLRRALWA